MSWNNWAYTKKKQKEMTKKSAAYQQVLENDSYKYTEFSKPQNATKWQDEKARDRRMKIITVVMLSLMSMVYISIITYFVIYGT